MTDTTWNVYECDPIRRGERPQNERLIESGFIHAMDAMDRANELRRANPSKSYTVGG